MKNSDQTTASPLPAFKLWELAFSFVALGLSGVLVYHRGLFFSKGEYADLTEHNILSFLVISLIVLCILLAGLPWQKISRFGSPLRYLAVGTTVMGMLSLIFWCTGWGRYQVIRFEAMVLNLGISSYQDGLRQNLNLELVDSLVGPYLYEDEALLDHLARLSPNPLLESPRAARLVLNSLQQRGHAVSDFATDGQPSEFLLACVMAESDPEPWHGLPWAEVAEVREVEESGFHAGLLKKAEAESILEPFLKGQAGIGRSALQGLVFACTQYPDLFSDRERDEVMLSWSNNFDELEPFAVEGLVIRSQFRELLAGARRLKVHVEQRGSAPSKYHYSLLPVTIPEMILGIVRSCGVELEVVESATQADLKIVVVLSESALYTYSKSTYEYQDNQNQKFEIRPWKPDGFPQRRSVTERKRVRTGSEDKTIYAPTASATATLGGNRVEFEPGLIYWHDLTYDKKNRNYKRYKTEDSWERMWPLGLQAKLFRYHYLEHSEDF